jgi:hypothetical protein
MNQHDPQLSPAVNEAESFSGWASILARISMAAIVFELVSGLAITVSPYHAVIQWNVILHTAIGAITLLPIAWYCVRHWQSYRTRALSQAVLLGWAALLALAVCSLSGVVVTWEALFGVRTTPLWRTTHLVSTIALLIVIGFHVILAAMRSVGLGGRQKVAGYATSAITGCAAGCALLGIAGLTYSGVRYVNRFPSDYSFIYGTNRPFAPSLARTDTGGAFDPRSLAGSASCGTAGCHEQIVQEWNPSAHRWAAMDTIFQGIQTVMAKQNGPESTRYCGGCHDPISLFSGSKNLFSEELTGSHGYNEGVSCLACHAIRETDVKGNANYTVTQPREYLWQWETSGLGRVARDFLIRSYPAEHAKLSKRMFKKPEYCAACHKQFIDQEVNRVGWVQLQNQYDNWAASHWNHKGDEAKTVECRECHMPLVASRDPAAGDSLDYNRKPNDGKHRSHRFIASNQLMPMALKDKVAGWEEQVKLTEQWLAGQFEIPEIRAKWAEGPIVKLALVAPDSVNEGQNIPLRVVMSSNKVGHDFPTGPLDIIQSWLEVTLEDDSGRVLFSSGKRDDKHFIQPGSFLFKAEPVDQHGNLIDRHNLWEMVGVRYRRALFPGYSDSVEYDLPCSGASAGAAAERTAKTGEQGKPAMESVKVPAPKIPGDYRIRVALQYRKVDQFLLNFLFGETNTLTSPVTRIAEATKTVKVTRPDVVDAR